MAKFPRVTIPVGVGPLDSSDESKDCSSHSGGWCLSIGFDPSSCVVDR